MDSSRQPFEVVRSESIRVDRGVYLDRGPDLPGAYGGIGVAALARDPYRVFAHWEILEEPPAVRLVRFGVPGGAWPVHAVGSDYFTALPDSEYQVEVGVIRGGRFEVQARSNRVRTPREGPASEADPAWFPDARQVEHLKALGVETIRQLSKYYGGSS